MDKSAETPLCQSCPIPTCRGCLILSSIPSAEPRKAAPKENWQADHEEGVRAKVGRDRKVAIECRGAHRTLESG